MEMTGLSIRPFRPGDERAVIRLWVECGLVVPHNDPSKDIARKCRTRPAEFLVAELDREIVATCMVGYDGHRGWINYLAVSPALRRRGIATRLMDEAERILRDAGCPKINLQVRSTNTAVIGFYASLGFREDAVVSMGKRLEPDAPFRILQDGTVVPESAE
jgi:ribosomal protein S18 acetylase RimI-like enzyme